LIGSMLQAAMDDDTMIVDEGGSGRNEWIDDEHLEITSEVW